MRETNPTPFLCAGCGREIENDSFGLCAECEEKIQASDSAWQPKPNEVPIER
jgi:predicted amidophosphoribosyltransferase